MRYIIVFCLWHTLYDLLYVHMYMYWLLQTLIIVCPASVCLMSVNTTFARCCSVLMKPCFFGTTVYSVERKTSFHRQKPTFWAYSSTLYRFPLQMKTFVQKSIKIICASITMNILVRKFMISDQKVYTLWYQLLIPIGVIYRRKLRQQSPDGTTNFIRL